jgi:hypothetical protein
LLLLLLEVNWRRDRKPSGLDCRLIGEWWEVVDAWQIATWTFPANGAALTLCAKPRNSCRRHLNSWLLFTS